MGISSCKLCLGASYAPFHAADNREYALLHTSQFAGLLAPYMHLSEDAWNNDDLARTWQH